MTRIFQFVQTDKNFAYFAYHFYKRTQKIMLT